MQLENYYTTSDNKLQFSRQQASHFAKLVAGDFNPIHDEDAKRFCVPGDLLFSVLLSKVGISKEMRIEFNGMINDGTDLELQDTEDGHLNVVDDAGKLYLTLERRGETINDPRIAEKIASHYVRFSGKNFPYIMVPLMEEAGMMINPARPLVMYESMELKFDKLTFDNPEVVLSETSMDIDGKRGVVTLGFSIKDNGEVIGKGNKRMLCSGLRPFETDEINNLVTEFYQRKDAFLSSVSA
ncbi:DUF3581 family protein [Veronia pacifica]|uniref:DUF3581 domain-containing protein n=1 Tax=Veronia pacifica TaxID=1080227 RepID=A0A1C3EEX4_9GAMM|nr:DUF3581 family protein [Veronia pacifica]ODA31788.1 hypothetical protein A8L45_15450 [Veronia pacifica]